MNRKHFVTAASIIGTNEPDGEGMMEFACCTIRAVAPLDDKFECNEEDFFFWLFSPQEGLDGEDFGRSAFFGYDKNVRPYWTIKQSDDWRRLALCFAAAVNPTKDFNYPEAANAPH